MQTANRKGPLGGYFHFFGKPLFPAAADPADAREGKTQQHQTVRLWNSCRYSEDDTNVHRPGITIRGKDAANNLGFPSVPVLRTLCLGRTATHTSVYQRLTHIGHESCVTVAEAAEGKGFVKNLDNKLVPQLEEEETD